MRASCGLGGTDDMGQSHEVFGLVAGLDHAKAGRECSSKAVAVVVDFRMDLLGKSGPLSTLKLHMHGAKRMSISGHAQAYRSGCRIHGVAEQCVPFELQLQRRLRHKAACRSPSRFWPASMHLGSMSQP